MHMALTQTLTLCPLCMQSTQFAVDEVGAASKAPSPPPPRPVYYSDQAAASMPGSPQIGRGGGPIFYDPAVHAFSPSSPHSSISSPSHPRDHLKPKTPAKTLGDVEVGEKVDQEEGMEWLKAQLKAKDEALVKALEDLQSLKETQQHREQVVRLEAEARSIQVRSVDCARPRSVECTRHRSVRIASTDPLHSLPLSTLRG